MKYTNAKLVAYVSSLTFYDAALLSECQRQAAKPLDYELREEQSKVAESFTSGRDVFISATYK